jgi:DNA-binding MarR family transcriptional regulator
MGTASKSGRTPIENGIHLYLWAAARKSFTVYDMMRELEISKPTAKRYINALERQTPITRRINKSDTHDSGWRRVYYSIQKQR